MTRAPRVGDAPVHDIAGPYVAGDVLSRFLRAEARSALYPAGPGGRPRAHPGPVRDTAAEPLRRLYPGVGGDVLRYAVCAQRPPSADPEPACAPARATTRAAAQAAGRARLDGLWNGWLEGLFTAVREECGGRVPAAEPAGAAWEELRERLLGLLADLRAAYGAAGFDPRRAVGLLDDVVAAAADFGRAHTAGRDRAAAAAGSRRAALAGQLAVAAALSAWAAPLLPEGSARLAAVLGVPADGPVSADALAVPRAAGPLSRTAGAVFGL